MTAVQTTEQPPLHKRIKKSLNRWARGRRAAIEGWLDSKSLIETTETIPNERLPWVAELEKNWLTIRRELEAVMPSEDAMPTMQELSPVQNTITEAKTWKVYMFRAFGSIAEENCRRCPETARMIAAIPNITTAFFSVLKPGAHLTAHHGAYKGLVRIHLGLIVPGPREKLRMAVGKEMLHWDEGRAFVFDDTYKHEVWNETDGTRVILLIDVERPFPPVLRAVNRTLLRIARLAPDISGTIKRFQAIDKAQPRKAA